ncbi:MAG: MMPL family transporter [Firmicutes bacterium]|nr:MMPL family transporter [Bacillota bacterium]
MFERIGTQIVRLRWVILTLCLLLAIPAAYGAAHTRVNYDLFSYMPADLPAMQGQRILDDHFRMNGSVVVLLQKTPDWRVLALKDRIAHVPNVSKVTWSDSLADLTVPKSFWPQALVDQFYAKDGSTLLQISLTTPPGDPRTNATISHIRALLDGGAEVTGEPAILADLQSLLQKQLPLYLVTAGGLLLVLLLAVMPSFLLPFLFLLAMGVGVVINLGIPYFTGGSLSYITQAIAAALQLGVSMDFSIFLIMRYLEERDHFPFHEAMAKAIGRTAQAVLASAATAIAGFLAMSAMNIGLGRDIGITMARGVAISVLLALTLLPSLILLCDGAVEKLRHRPLIPQLDGLGRLVMRHPWTLIGILVLLVVPAAIGNANNQVDTNVNHMMPQKIASIQALDAVTSRFGLADASYIVIGHTLAPNREQALVDAVKDVAGVSDVVGYATLADPTVPVSFVPQAVRDQFIDGQTRYYMVTTQADASSDQGQQTLAHVQQVVSRFGPGVYLSGQAVLENDLSKMISGDQRRVDLYSIVGIAAIIGVAFLSFSIPVLLVAVIELAVFLNLGLSFFLGQSVPFVASLALGAIQLGSTINYALLLTSRYREERATRPPREAIAAATARSAQAIIASGLSLCLALVGIWVLSDIPILSQLTQMIARGALLSMTIILCLLPAVLYKLTPVIERTTLHWGRSQKAEGNVPVGVGNPPASFPG